MNIKEMLNNVLAQSGFLERSQFFGSADPDDKQMTAIANRVGIEIMNFYEWNELRFPYEIDLIEGQTEYALPFDMKWIVSDSSWETDGSRRVDNQISNNVWYQYKFSSLTSGGVIRAKQYGKTLQVIDPFAGGRITFEYISNGYATDDATVPNPKTAFTLDTDLWTLDDQLLVLGIQAHWQQTKLMPGYQEHYMNYMRKMNEAIGRDGVSNTIGGGIQQTRRSPYTKLWVN
jgi:hypothetical protein